MAVRGKERGEGVPLSELAVRLADELEQTMAIAEDCQTALGEVMEHGLTQPLALRLQSLDLLTQRLDEVATLLRRLGRLDGGGGEIPLKMFDAIRLSDVSRRLTGAGEIAAAEREAEFW
ncbi:MAG TPA: hypothetical protein VG939_08350 [Caulobacteraceae bacterium]|nr:hypothetical protein [Caulobacteraceae bacterium]